MGNKRKPNESRRRASTEENMAPLTAAEKAAAAATAATAAATAENDAQDARVKRMMDHFDRMQAATNKAFNKQSKENCVDADVRQEALLRQLLPTLAAQAPTTAAPRTGPNLLAASGSGTGSHSHYIPSTGLISAAASGYDAQLMPLGHLIGEFSSGSTQNDDGR
jgi:hypothetical protein